MDSQLFIVSPCVVFLQFKIPEIHFCDRELVPVTPRLSYLGSGLVVVSLGGSTSLPARGNTVNVDWRGQRFNPARVK